MNYIMDTEFFLSQFSLFSRNDSDLSTIFPKISMDRFNFRDSLRFDFHYKYYLKQYSIQSDLVLGVSINF